MSELICCKNGRAFFCKKRLKEACCEPVTVHSTISFSGKEENLMSFDSKCNTIKLQKIYVCKKVDDAGRANAYEILRF